MTERPPPHKSLPCFIRNPFQTHWIDDMKFEINDDVVLKLAGGGLVRHRDGPSPQPHLGEGPPVLFTTLGTSQVAMGCSGAHFFCGMPCPMLPRHLSSAAPDLSLNMFAGRHGRTPLGRTR